MTALNLERQKKDAKMFGLTRTACLHEELSLYLSLSRVNIGEARSPLGVSYFDNILKCFFQFIEILKRVILPLVTLL